MQGGSCAYARGCPGRTKVYVTHFLFVAMISAWHGHLDVRDRCSPTTDRRGVLVSHVNYSFLDIDDWILWVCSDRGVEITRWKGCIVSLSSCVQYPSMFLFVIFCCPICLVLEPLLYCESTARLTVCGCHLWRYSLVVYIYWLCKFYISLYLLLAYTIKSTKHNPIVTVIFIFHSIIRDCGKS